MKKVAVGVIGAGVLGGFHLRKCLANGFVECVGFHDSNARRAQEVSLQLQLPALGVQELLDRCEAVIVAIPCSEHLRVGRICLQQAKHVLMEKPLAASYEEGCELVRLAAEKNLVLHVGHSELFNPAFRQLLAMKPQPRFLEIHRLSAFSHRGTDVSVVLDLMVHDLHLLLRLCDEEPVHANIAATGVAVVSPDIDIANVRIPFPSGCAANLTASRISLKKMRKVRIFQKDNYFSVDLDSRRIDHCFLNRESTEAFPIAVKSHEPEAQDALEAEQKSFIDALGHNDGIFATTGNEALRVLRTTDAIMNKLQEETHTKQ
ncbi:MAG: gfo/Idh/MocA family oxidoreductase [Chitinivibrionales bacterium]|nr:gfo/Idh/MocA family oxidoreductase [Chitinivibrionales bacterium]